MLKKPAITIALVIAYATLFLASGAVAQDAATYTYARHYTDKQVSRYTYVEQDAGSSEKFVAHVNVASFVRNGVGGDRITWTSITDKQGTDLSALARAFAPYELSLDPKAVRGLYLNRPAENETFAAAADDLLNFYVNLSRPIGIEHLHRASDTYIDPDLITGDFSGQTNTLGGDFTQLTSTLKRLGPGNVEIESSFQPPKDRGVAPLRPWMAAPICGFPNNFQIVTKQSAGYIVLWGCEAFVIHSTVERASGRLTAATMADTLNIKAKLCTDKDLTACNDIPLSHIERDVTMTLDA